MEKESTAVKETPVEHAVQEYLDETSIFKSVPKKEYAKIFISGFVGGCSGAIASVWLRRFEIAIVGVPEIVNKVINEVGIFGIKSLLITRVMQDTKEGLDTMDDFIELQKHRRKIKKALMNTKKAAKAKYVEVTEEE